MVVVVVVSTRRGSVSGPPVKPQLKILSGGRAGAVEVFSKPLIDMGRHPSCDLRFDPDSDLDVSAHHAALVKQGNHWIIRDLGSRNGTLLNGHRIVGDARLDRTDHIRFGPEGPSVEFLLVTDDTPDTPPPTFTETGAPLRPSSVSGSSPAASPTASPAPVARAAVPPPPQRPATPPARPPSSLRPSTTQRIRLEVARQTKRWRVVTLVLVGVVVVAVAGFVFENQRRERERAAVAARAQARIDSILRAADESIRALEGQVAGLADALHGSQAQVQDLQTRLQSATRAGNAPEVANLRRQLDQASEALRRQQVAAQVDYRTIYAANQRALAIIYVEFGPGEVVTGTAFGVRRDGLMMTNRHVVAGESGNRTPQRVALRFADSDQVFKGRVVVTSPEVDLALVRVENLVGDVPTVSAFNPRSDTLQPGDPVATIGFPLGTDLPMTERDGRFMARTTFGAGIITKVLPNLLQIDGYGAQGASGSPVFDRTGRVVGVLYGGQVGTGGRVIYAVPGGYAEKMISAQ